MLGCTGSFSPTNSSSAPDANSAQDLYIHGYISGRIFKTSSSSGAPGLPITVAASFLDGLVLSLTPFHNSCNYRSAVVYGYASLVDDEAEALYAMKIITDNMLPERWAKSRSPPTKAELASTAILRVRIESVSFPSLLSSTSCFFLGLSRICRVRRLTPHPSLRPQPRSASAAQAKTATI